MGLDQSLDAVISDLMVGQPANHDLEGWIECAHHLAQARASRMAFHSTQSRTFTRTIPRQGSLPVTTGTMLRIPTGDPQRPPTSRPPNATTTAPSGMQQPFNGRSAFRPYGQRQGSGVDIRAFEGELQGLSQEDLQSMLQTLSVAVDASQATVQVVE